MPDAGHGRGALDQRALEKILEVTRQLAAPFRLGRMLTRVVDAGREVLDADRGTVFLYDAETEELYSRVATGAAPIRFPVTKGIAGECARTREIINVPDCYSDPRFNPEMDRKFGYKTRCSLSVPLMGLDDSLVGVLQLLNKKDGVFDEQDERVAEALAAQCAVALERMQMVEQRVVQEKMERELALARDIQIGMLPRSMPELDAYEVSGMSRPADETGGDTFDMVPVKGGGLTMLLGDATGHGIGPALSVTQVRSMLRIAVRIGADLDDTFRHINDQLTEDLADNLFVTAFLGQLDAVKHVVRYHAAGQAPILLYRAADKRVEWLDSTTMPMGFMEILRDPKSESVDLQPGDILGLMTDGVFECEDPAEEQYGQERVAALIGELHDRPVSEIVERLLADVDVHADGGDQADDITILLLRRRR